LGRFCKKTFYCQVNKQEYRDMLLSYFNEETIAWDGAFMALSLFCSLTAVPTIKDDNLHQLFIFILDIINHKGGQPNWYTMKGYKML